MSIAIHSSKGPGHAAAAAAVSRRREAAPDAATPERSAEAKAPKGRHALMNALADALASLGSAAGATSASGTAGGTATPAVTTPEQKEALHAFAHELFNALRPTPDPAVKGHQGRGFAWGRTSLGDLSERLAALAQKLTGATAPAAGSPAAIPAAGAAPTTPAPTGSATGPTTGTDAAVDTAAQRSVAATADAATPAAAAEPVDPPVTVPAPVVTPALAVATAESPLLAAFRQLATALHGSTSGADATPPPADALAALLNRMSQALVSAARVDTPVSGSLVDVTA